VRPVSCFETSTFAVPEPALVDEVFEP